MFKLIRFSLKQHSILKDVDIDFIEEKEIPLVEAPFTTVLIGSNGVGKSQLLRAISEVLRELHTVIYKKAIWARGFHFSITYQLNENSYTFRNTSYIAGPTKSKRQILAYKNVPFSLLQKGGMISSEYDVDLDQVKFPNKLLVSSIMLNDKFAFADSNPLDFYQYLGIRRTASQTSTLTFTRNTIKYLFDASKAEDYKSSLSELLTFMGLEKTIKVSYSLKYKPVFERKDANRDSFHKFFTEWWNVEGVRRGKDRKLWGKWYYDKIKDDDQKIKKLLLLVNKINKKLSLKSNSNRAKEYIIDLFAENQDFEDFKHIEELVYLDILRVEGIKIKKENVKEYGVESSSSGEYHLLLTLLGVFSRVEQDSIIFLDEPEISLHPNWQMRYIHELKNIFNKFKTCHFIIASHSHFIVSDLKDESSAIVVLTKDAQTQKINTKLLTDEDTYGWSSEEVLLKVFNTASDRNYFLAEQLGNVLELISNNDKHDNNALKNEINELKKIDFSGLSDEDPLKEVVAKIFNKL